MSSSYCFFLRSQVLSFGAKIEGFFLYFPHMFSGEKFSLYFPSILDRGKFPLCFPWENLPLSWIEGNFPYISLGKNSLYPGQREMSLMFFLGKFSFILGSEIFPLNFFRKKFPLSWIEGNFPHISLGKSSRYLGQTEISLIFPQEKILSILDRIFPSEKTPSILDRGKFSLFFLRTKFPLSWIEGNLPYYLVCWQTF